MVVMEAMAAQDMEVVMGAAIVVMEWEVWGAWAWVWEWEECMVMEGMA